MSYAVYKYPVEQNNEIVIEIPQYAEILTIQTQYGKPYIWALIDTRMPRVARRFILAGTGHPIQNKDELTYIGTFQLEEGSLVFHLFECTRR